jgi:hypothetical protein
MSKHGFNKIHILRRTRTKRRIWTLCAEARDVEWREWGLHILTQRKLALQERHEYSNVVKATAKFPKQETVARMKIVIERYHIVFPPTNSKFNSKSNNHDRTLYSSNLPKRQQSGRLHLASNSPMLTAAIALLILDSDQFFVPSSHLHALLRPK